VCFLYTRIRASGVLCLAKDVIRGTLVLDAFFLFSTKLNRSAEK